MRERVRHKEFRLKCVCEWHHWCVSSCASLPAEHLWVCLRSTTTLFNTPTHTHTKLTRLTLSDMNAAFVLSFAALVWWGAECFPFLWPRWRKNFQSKPHRIYSLLPLEPGTHRSTSPKSRKLTFSVLGKTWYTLYNCLEFPGFDIQARYTLITFGNFIKSRWNIGLQFFRNWGSKSVTFETCMF